MPVLLATLLPLIIQHIPSIIQMVESLFGPKTGPTKLQVSTDMLKQITDALAAAGKIPGIPDQSSLALIIESVFQQMKAAGQATGTLIAPVGAITGTLPLPKASYQLTGVLELR
jgi:hypothetical protein